MRAVAAEDVRHGLADLHKRVLVLASTAFAGGLLQPPRLLAEVLRDVGLGECLLETVIDNALRGLCFPNSCASRRVRALIEL